MSRAEQFLELYKQLEAVVANNYGFHKEGGSVAKLGRREEFKPIRAELDYIRDVRNLLSHRPKLKDSFMVEPSQAMIDLLKDVLKKVENPAIAENIMVPLKQVLCCTEEDPVLKTLGRMNKRGISSIPILKDGRVCGVFSEGTFVQCTLSGEYTVTEETVFSDIRKETSLDREHPEVFLYTDRDTPIDELSDMIEDARTEGKKVGMIFVTKHGRASEELRGIITAWDIAAAY